LSLHYSQAQKKSGCVISVTSQPKLNRYLVRRWTSEGQPAWWDSRWARYLPACWFSTRSPVIDPHGRLLLRARLTPCGRSISNYQVSMTAAERVLLPKIRQAADDVIILANGFSCREQIEQGSSRKTLHIAELLSRALGVEA
jgi:hypothetical protein